MNSNADNKYERYVVADDWNLCQSIYGTTEATRFTVAEQFTTVMKMLHGVYDEGNGSFGFPQGWLYDAGNAALVRSYYQEFKITRELMLEFGVDSAVFPPIKKSIVRAVKDEVEEENKKKTYAELGLDSTSESSEDEELTGTSLRTTRSKRLVTQNF